jgi:hypothetical protein
MNSKLTHIEAPASLHDSMQSFKVNPVPPLVIVRDPEFAQPKEPVEVATIVVVTPLSVDEIVLEL